MTAAQVYTLVIIGIEYPLIQVKQTNPEILFLLEEEYIQEWKDTPNGLNTLMKGEQFLLKLSKVVVPALFRHLYELTQGNNVYKCPIIDQENKYSEKVNNIWNLTKEGEQLLKQSEELEVHYNKNAIFGGFS